MKKKFIGVFILLLLFTCFFKTDIVSAASLKVGSQYTSNWSVMYKTLDSATAYCIDGPTVPAKTTSCDKRKNKLTNYQRSVIAQLIKKYCSSPTKCTNKDSYVAAEVAITAYLLNEVKYIGAGKGYGDGYTKFKDDIQNAKKTSTENIYNNRTKFDVEFSEDELNFSQKKIEGKEYYVSQNIKLEKIPYVDGSPTITVEGHEKAKIIHNKNGSFYIRIPANKIENKTKIVLKASAKQKKYYIVDEYACDVGQDVVTFVEDQESGKDKITGKINYSGDGTLEISKRTSSSGNKLIIGYTATFDIYEGEGCVEGKEIDSVKTKKLTGIATIKLEKGTYYVKETKSPNGYKKSNECKKVTIVPGEIKKIDFLNEPKCEGRLRELGENPTKNELIKLYKNNPNYTNLLNFDDPDCSAAECSYLSDVECFAGNFSYNDFNKNNVSCYTDSHDTDNGTAYCLTTFNLENLVGTNWSATSGRLLFDSNDGKVIKSTLSQKCYLFKLSNENLPPEFEISQKYSDIIDIEVKKETVENQDETEKIKLSFNSDDNLKKMKLTRKGNSNLYEGTIAGVYKVNPIYVENISGKLSESLCGNCKFLGYGIISNLNYNSNEKLESALLFNYQFKTDNKKIVDSAECPYKIKGNLITDNKLNLEFRTINTSNPFSGKNGTGRNAKSNWCEKTEDGSLDCTGTNTLINNEIVNANNSYNQSGSGALYTIELTPSDIKDIRNYNKETSYNDYNRSCDKGVCTNYFLNKFNIKKVD